jgi:hypothetical protein
MIVNDELVRMWKEIVMTYFKVHFQHFAGGNPRLLVWNSKLERLEYESEYIKLAVADSRQGVLLQCVGWAYG